LIDAVHYTQSGGARAACGVLEAVGDDEDEWME
jgi:hypothetical protein